MYNVNQLLSVAQSGLKDLAPAVVQAFNQDPSDDKLELVYGEPPRFRIIGLALVSVVVGQVFGLVAPTNMPLLEYVYWPAVAAAVVYALIIRRYLFVSGQAQAGDFPWLAASLVPVTVFASLLAVLNALLFGDVEANGAFFWLDKLLSALIDALGVAAAITIAIATLCFHKNWPGALMDLAIRLFVFKVMVWVTQLVLLEIGIVGPILSAALESIFDISIPRWIPELADLVSYGALMSVIYLSVIGATWTVCKNSFSELLETGHVDILKAIEAMAKKEKKDKKQDSKTEEQA